MKPLLTLAQRRLLAFARDWQSLNDGTIEATLQTGLSGPSQGWVRAALVRRGFIDINGEITDAGRAALSPQTTKESL